EAAASGVPTFAFNVVGVRDSVTAGGTGLLFQRDDGVKQIAREISAALADRDAFGRRFSGARQIVAERYGQQSVWDRYAKAYFDVSANSVRIAARAVGGGMS